MALPEWVKFIESELAAANNIHIPEPEFVIGICESFTYFPIASHASDGRSDVYFANIEDYHKEECESFFPAHRVFLHKVAQRKNTLVENVYRDLQNHIGLDARLSLTLLFAGHRLVQSTVDPYIFNSTVLNYVKDFSPQAFKQYVDTHRKKEYSADMILLYGLHMAEKLHERQGEAALELITTAVLDPSPLQAFNQISNMY